MVPSSAYFLNPTTKSRDRSLKIMGPASDNGVDQLSGNTIKFGFALGSTCKLLEVYGHSSDMIEAVF